MVREDMLWTKPGLPIAKQRGSRVLPSFFASVKCSITQASELRSEIGKVGNPSGQRASPLPPTIRQTVTSVAGPQNISADKLR